MTNQDLRFRAKSLGVPFWKIGEKLGVTEVTITRRFRKELSPEQKQMYLDIIQQIVAERVASDLNKIDMEENKLDMEENKLDKTLKGLSIIIEFLGERLPGQRDVFEAYINILKDAQKLLKSQKWHYFHVRELTDDEKAEHPDWVSITECDDYEPNNGEEFLYYRKCFNSIGIDTWDDDMWADYACTGDGEHIEDGDAWMELPELPRQ